jgi:hypothetical protein
MAYTGLAKTTFMAGPEDALAAADAYKANDIKSAAIETVDYSLSLPDSPVGLKIKPLNISGIGLKVPSYDQTDILKAVASDVSIKNCFTNMADSAKGLMSIPGKMLGKVEAVVNGVVTKIKSLGDAAKNFDLKGALDKIGNLKAIGCSANALSNGNFSLSVVDKGGLTGLISGLTKQGSALGINNVFSSISNVVTDKDVLLGACRDILPTAVKDIGLLKDLSSTGVCSSIKSMMPSISGNSISNFRINPGSSSFQLPSMYNDLKYTLNRVDSTWNSAVRDGTSVLSGVNTVSKDATDFHKVLSSSVMADYHPIPFAVNNQSFSLSTAASDDAFLMVTKDVGVQDAGALIKEQFASLPITMNPTSDNKSLINNLQVEAASISTKYKNTGTSILKIETTPDTNTTTISKEWNGTGIII